MEGNVHEEMHPLYFHKWTIHSGTDCAKQLRHIEQQEVRVHMAFVARQEELRAKSSYGMSSNKILRINRLI